MPQYNRRDHEAMRQDAIRRSKEMYHKAESLPKTEAYDFLPLRLEESERRKPFPPLQQNSRQTQSAQNAMPAGLLGGWNPMELLEKFDKDQILILVLLVMLYKEGGDKKLLMALAYLLT